MIQSIIRYMHGYVKIRVEGYSPERFLNLCRHHQIYIWGLNPCGNAYEMYMSLKGSADSGRLSGRLIQKFYLSRETVFLSFCINTESESFFLSALSFVLASYIFIRVLYGISILRAMKGPNETLLEFLETKDVSPHMAKRKVDCAQIVKDIRKEYDDIVWVSASIDGSRLRIQIKENEDTFREEAESADGAGAEGQGDASLDAGKETETPSDLIATKDGVITSIITRSGIPQVHVGDTVAKGDVLVTGRIEVLNDAGEVTGYQYQKSDADIFADTQLNYEDSISTTYKKKYYEKSQRRLYYIKAGSWYISAGTVKNDYKEWEMYTNEHQLKLGENFYLPISYGSKIVRSYTSKEKPYTKEELQKQLSSNFKQFSKELEENDVQIRENRVKIHISKNTAMAKGILYLNERITQEADTEIMEIENEGQEEAGGPQE